MELVPIKIKKEALDYIDELCLKSVKARHEIIDDFVKVSKVSVKDTQGIRQDTQEKNEKSSENMKASEKYKELEKFFKGEP